MQRERREAITLEQKLRYLREIDKIYALGKKARAPAGGKSWAQVADARLRHVMQMPLKEEAGPQIQVLRGGMHHMHSPRTARLIERTLKNGIVPPAVHHSYAHDVRGETSYKPHVAVEPLRHDDFPVAHYVQHGASDLHYPAGHMQGVGFLPREHTAVRHVKLEMPSTRVTGGIVPTASAISASGGAAGAGSSHYH